VVATTALKPSEGMSRIMPSAIALAGYGIAFFGLTRALQTIPLGVTYAIWSEVGILALTLIGLVVYRQALGAWEVLGVARILAGVIVINWRS
jgi:small multidrug resistance pump